MNYKTKKYANADAQVVDDFGKEWKTFNQQKLSNEELARAFDEYFNIFPFNLINQYSVGFDMGCGSGRWAKLMAPKVGKLNCIDPSGNALEQAKNNLRNFNNCNFECAAVDETILENGSQDFGYCLGVLHHIPDTQSGLQVCANKLKKGAPFLLYLYYRFDNWPLWFKLLWQFSDYVRRIICKLPFSVKLFLSQLIAIFVYFPFSKIAFLFERLGCDVSRFPLAAYRNKSFYFLRTDALDRFGTRIEKRFTKNEISKMLDNVGFLDIKFSDRSPFWVVVGIKK